MKVTKDVVSDLMPLYLAGEASEDTRRLIEEYLRLHPEEPADEAALVLPRPEPPPGLGLANLEMTQRLLSWRSTALGAAYAVSYAVFSFRFGREGLSFVLYRDLPVTSWVLLGLAACLWAAFLTLHGRWFAVGLAAEGRLAGGTWLVGGALAVLPYAFVASYRFGLDDVRALCVVGAFAGLALRTAIHRRRRA